MSNNLVPVGELKPRDFFLHNDDEPLCLKLANEAAFSWYVWRDRAENYHCKSMRSCIGVQPLPDCDSFDWQLPREPTAMELATALRDELVQRQNFDAACRVREIMDAMELEAGQ